MIFLPEWVSYVVANCYGEGAKQRAAQQAAAQQAAASEQRRQYQQNLADMAVLGLGSFSTLAPSPKLPKPHTPGPCGGCGSRETIVHNGARMCAYCRGDR